MGIVRTTFTALGLAASGYAGVSAALAWSLTRTVRVRSDETPESVGLEFRDVDFTSRGGDAALSGWLIPPDSRADPPGTTAQSTPWIVMVHGDNSSRSDSKTGMLGIARALRERGFGIFMFDMRGRGDSPSSLSSSGYFERLDLQGASDYLVSKGADRKRIGVLGFSLALLLEILELVALYNVTIILEFPHIFSASFVAAINCITLRFLTPKIEIHRLDSVILPPA